MNEHHELPQYQGLHNGQELLKSADISDLDNDTTSVRRSESAPAGITPRPSLPQMDVRILEQRSNTAPMISIETPTPVEPTS